MLVKGTGPVSFPFDTVNVSGTDDGVPMNKMNGPARKELAECV